MHFQEGVDGIGLAGQQGLELAPRGFALQLLERGLRIGDDRLILLGLAELDQRDLVVQLLLDPADRLELIVERVALLHDLGGALRIVPQAGVFGELVQLGQTRIGRIEVKDASSAARPTA